MLLLFFPFGGKCIFLWMKCLECIKCVHFHHSLKSRWLVGYCTCLPSITKHRFIKFFVYDRNFLLIPTQNEERFLIYQGKYLIILAEIKHQVFSSLYNSDCCGSWQLFLLSGSWVSVVNWHLCCLAVKV